MCFCNYTHKTDDKNNSKTLSINRYLNLNLISSIFFFLQFIFNDKCYNNNLNKIGNKSTKRVFLSSFKLLLQTVIIACNVSNTEFSSV